MQFSYLRPLIQQFTKILLVATVPLSVLLATAANASSILTCQLHGDIANTNIVFSPSQAGLNADQVTFLGTQLPKDSWNATELHYSDPFELNLFSDSEEKILVLSGIRAADLTTEGENTTYSGDLIAGMARLQLEDGSYLVTRFGCREGSFDVGELNTPETVEFPAKGASVGGKFRAGPGTTYAQPFARNYKQFVTIIGDTGLEEQVNADWRVHWIEVETEEGRAFQPSSFLCLIDGWHPKIATCETGQLP